MTRKGPAAEVDKALDSVLGEKQIPLRLNTVANCRRSLARVVRARGRNQIAEADFRALVWGISQLLGAFKLELETDVEQRLQELEAEIRHMNAAAKRRNVGE